LNKDGYFRLNFLRLASHAVVVAASAYFRFSIAVTIAVERSWTYRWLARTLAVGSYMFTSCWGFRVIEVVIIDRV
jgi:hypothetical protein